MFAYSLRSIGDFDVSELAKRYGGGGHKNSAGFTSHGLVHNWTSRLVYDQLLERLASK
jgi:nanoRNase/pAp phosphatase (c-di-AMP/oligoRNAs hydrolase)